MFQNSPSSHQGIAGNKSSVQTERGNNVNKPIPSAHAVSPGNFITVYDNSDQII